jgi:hypothetical protein
LPPHRRLLPRRQRERGAMLAAIRADYGCNFAFAGERVRLKFVGDDGNTVGALRNPCNGFPAAVYNISPTPPQNTIAPPKFPLAVGRINKS